MCGRDDISSPRENAARHHQRLGEGAPSGRPSGLCCLVPPGAESGPPLRSSLHLNRLLSIGLFLALHPVESAQSKNRCLLHMKLVRGWAALAVQTPLMLGGMAPGTDERGQVSLKEPYTDRGEQPERMSKRPRHPRPSGSGEPFLGILTLPRSKPRREPRRPGRGVPSTPQPPWTGSSRTSRGAGGQTGSHLTVPFPRAGSLGKTLRDRALGTGRRCFKGALGEAPSKQVVCTFLPRWSSVAGSGGWLVSCGPHS